MTAGSLQLASGLWELSYLMHYTRTLMTRLMRGWSPQVPYHGYQRLQQRCRTA